jgi:hypothetical protein
VSRSPIRRRRAVLAFSIAILPWAAVSALGERGPGSSGAVPNAPTTVEAFTSIAVVASDRPSSTLLFVRRGDRTHTTVTMPVGLALAHPSALVREAGPASPTARIAPLAVHLAGRGPPLLAAA